MSDLRGLCRWACRWNSASGWRPLDEQAALERRVLTDLHRPIVPSLNGRFEKFEVLAAKVDSADKPAHRSFVRRQLHPLVFCAPFAYRTFHKPLGYAGDYEMVNMILRDPYDGGSLFAKSLHAWFVSQPPAEAHRNRGHAIPQDRGCWSGDRAGIARKRGRRARIFNLGCGPAGEVQAFLAEHELSNRADLTLLDFNDETLAYTTKILGDLKKKHERSTPIQMVKRSVGQLLKGRGRSAVTAPSRTTKYDFLWLARDCSITCLTGPALVKAVDEHFL